ncbi:olfactory receptor 2A12-like [Hyperolius riggenbachi]|uniref:olfactory receptor 2A12-like n=1 Tax=Hyperolius riggenbachi TaxID=752182 RepID=UPI0035A29265
MNKNNETVVTRFRLLGFQEISGSKKYVFFFAIFTAYITTLLINFLIIGLVHIKSQLHSPMYFFLQQLSIVEITFLTIIIPNMLYVLWLEGAMILVKNCIAQTYFYCAVGCAECHLLAVMAYDRYLAICKPLHYHTIMNTNHQRALVIYCWTFGFLLTQITLNFLCQLDFCGPYIIDHFFCDLMPFLKLTCSYIFALQVEILAGSIPLMIIPFTIILISYVYVFITILGISSSVGRKKAFSTCSSHLIVVTVYFGSLISIYDIPANGDSMTSNKLLSLLYIVVTPLFNPIIYSLRNKEIRVIISNLFGAKQTRIMKG